MIESLLRNHLAGFRAGRLLDVGPGYGSFSRASAEVTGACSVTYIDCNQDVISWQIEECRKKGLTAEGLLFPLEPAPLEALPGRYDLILCQEILEHLSDAECILSSLVELLTPGGRMVITVPTKFSERWLKRINPRYMQNDSHAHVREFDEAQLRDLLRQAGLRPLVFRPAQAHFFLAHTWVFGTRMRVEESTGVVLTKGVRGFMGRKIFKLSKWLFSLKLLEGLGRLLPRNYFVVAERELVAGSGQKE